MKSLLLLLPLLVQGPADTAPEADPEDAATPEEAVVAWDGTLAAGMSEVLRLAGEEEYDQALEVTGRLLEPNGYARLRARLEERTGGWSEGLFHRFEAPLVWLGYETLSAPDRAEVRFARGLLHTRLGGVLSADEEFELARVHAGEGALRGLAIYAQGTLDLLRGEELRQVIPEISGVAPAGPPVPPGPGAEKPTDPLELAREAYRAARAHFVERLRLDWRDADTRANVELVLRRLRELEEIERQREEQQQEDREEGEGDQDQEGEPDENGKQDQEQDPSEQPQERPDDPDGEEREPEEDPQAQAQREQPQELELTQEEMKRLLRRLELYQEEQEKFEEALRKFLQQRRAQEKRDW